LSGAEVNVGDSLVDYGWIIVEEVVDFAFVKELGVLSIDWLCFDCNFKVSFDVDGLIDL
jgi:hypothetical protein